MRIFFAAIGGGIVGALAMLAVFWWMMKDMWR